MGRISSNEYFMKMAWVASERATCSRRRVGCVLTNSRKHIIATGYNGVAAGLPHCLDHPCAGAACASGTGLDLCEAIHAEANALLQCKDVYDIHVAYVTTSPCTHCVKLLLNTSCLHIVFDQIYPHSTAEALWKSAGRSWLSIKDV